MEIAKLNELYELKMNAPPPEPGTDKFNLKKQKDKNARKEHKRLVKEAKAAARKNKIPKKVKKRAKIFSRKSVEYAVYIFVNFIYCKKSHNCRNTYIINLIVI